MVGAADGAPPPAPAVELAGGPGDELDGFGVTQIPPSRMPGGVHVGLALVETGVLDDGGALLDWVGVGVGVGVGELDVADALELAGAGAGAPISCLVASGITGRPPR